MARVLLPLLACAVAVKCGRDYDYSGASMPHYHFEPGSKRAVPLDYESYDKGVVPAVYDSDDEKTRYEKDHPGFEDNNKIQRHKYLPDIYVKEENINDDELQFEDNIPESKLTTQIRKNNGYYDSNSRGLKYIGKDDIDSLDRRFSSRKKSSEENKRVYDREAEYYYMRKNYNRKARRKPRDRAINREILHERDNNKQIDTERIDRNPIEDDLEEGHHIEIQSSSEGIEHPSKLTNFKKIQRKSNSNDYEYFDMQRINRIKDKLPTLLGSSKVRNNEPSSQEHLLTESHHRIIRQGLSTALPETEETNTTYFSKITMEEDIQHSDTSSAADSVAPVTINKTEQSLAEKSRLSILRKANKKISLRNSTWTTKPPVLMQVTQRMQTVVMVERLNANNRRSELKEISNESPSRIAKAKKLMRHKLVSNAKNIQELTDNWDEMVCDYIDVSLLENKGVSTTFKIKCILFLVLSTFWLSL